MHPIDCTRVRFHLVSLMLAEMSKFPKKFKFLRFRAVCTKARDSDNRGAVSIEFALVGLIVIVLALVIVDISRYVWTKSVLLKATQSSARAAASISGFEINTYVLDPIATDPNTVSSFMNFNKARVKAETEAYRFSKTAIPHSKSFLDYKSGTNVSRFLPISLLPYRSPVDFSGESHLNRITDVAIVRPGERIEKADPASGSGLGTYTNHTSLCPVAGDCRTTCKQADGVTPCFIIDEWVPGSAGAFPFMSDDMVTIYKSHPIMVEMRARIQTITPWIFGKELTVTARSYSYREITPLGTEPANNPESEPKLTPCDSSAVVCDPATEVLNTTTCACDVYCDTSALACDAATEKVDLATCACVPLCSAPPCRTGGVNPCEGIDLSSCGGRINYNTCACIPTTPGTPGCAFNSLSCFPQFLLYEYSSGTCKCSNASS